MICILQTFFLSFFFLSYFFIADSLKEKATPLVNYLIKTHRQRNFKIHYFVFEGVFDGKHSDGVVLQDCVSETLSYENLKKTINNVAHDDIIIIDSLSNAFIHYGYSQVYKILHELCGNKGEIKYFCFTVIFCYLFFFFRRNQTSNRHRAFRRFGGNSKNNTNFRTLIHVLLKNNT